MDRDCLASEAPTPMKMSVEKDRCRPEYDIAVAIADIIEAYANSCEKELNLCKVRMFAEAMLNR